MDLGIQGKWALVGGASKGLRLGLRTCTGLRRCQRGHGGAWC
jgi:hypothetical protein